MSRASIKTKLPLATWAKYMGIHPLHFEQVRMEGIDPHCDQLMFQYGWQGADHVSREEVAQAIAEAEHQIETYLKFRLAPSWEVDEWHGTVLPYTTEFLNYNFSGPRGFNQTVKGNWGYLISGGIKSMEVIEENAEITYTDTNSDGYPETATVQVATDVQDKSEICIFYPGKEGDEAWEIRPIEVSISGVTATITFRRELAVKEILLEAYDIEGAEAVGNEDEDFLEEVDVYRRYNDPQTQASFLWEPFAGGWCSSCDGSGCSSCSYSSQTGCLLLRGDPRLSIMAYHAAEWDSDTNTFINPTTFSQSRQPDLVRLYYYAGWRKKDLRYTNRMDPDWERTVAYLAASLLDRPPCSCATGDWEKWRVDLQINMNDEVRRVFYGVSSDLDNPFGTKAGQVYAWRKVKTFSIAEAVVT